MVTIRTEKGSITVVNDVFTTLAGVAATNCFGVRGMALRSVTDGLVHLLKREVMGKGVRITVHDDGEVTRDTDVAAVATEGHTHHVSLTVELHIIAKTGVNLPVVCGSIIEEVGYKLLRDTGIAIRAVNVCVDSIMTD